MTRPLGACAVTLVGVLLGTSCGNKNSSANTEGDHKDVAPSFDESETPAGERKPVEGADLGKLAAPEKQRFEKLVDKLSSPCGKAHSLRTSRNTDAQCIRARFAVDYVLNLLADGAPDEDVVKLYNDHYKKDDKKYTFRLSADVPHEGPADARVVIVEFFDFGCPACHDFWPELAKVIEAYPNDVVVYYKQFPLGAHPDSRGAAQAALATAKQGKYHEMHNLLFQNPEAHKKEELVADAKSLGVDMGKFESDYAALAAQVEADKKEGEEAGVDGTPTLFINGRKYADPMIEKYVKMWIEEELAVNR